MCSRILAGLLYISPSAPFISQAGRTEYKQGNAEACALKPTTTLAPPPFIFGAASLVALDLSEAVCWVRGWGWITEHSHRWLALWRWQQERGPPLLRRAPGVHRHKILLYGRATCSLCDVQFGALCGARNQFHYKRQGETGEHCFETILRILQERRWHQKYVKCECNSLSLKQSCLM